jgi:hypothetical protein
MNFVRNINYFLYFIFWHILRCAYLMGLYTPPIKPKTFSEENSEYINPLKTRFIKLFENTIIDFNENIDKLFYDKSKFTNYMSESNTSLEKLWKSKIMMENTPRGNIIMFYDAYKLGFSFYCDQKVISYDILNAAAMKYVSMFRCRHFFMDESIVPDEQKSPLIDIHFPLEKKPHSVIKKQKDDKIAPRWLNQLTPPEPTEPEKMKNKFVYLGKIANYSITQNVPKPRKVLAKFVSPELESLGGKKLEYKDYKNWLKQQAL